MRLVSMHEDGVLELNWMWLPVFIGQNHGLMRAMELEWKRVFGGTPLLSTDAVLDQIHDWTIKWLCEHMPIDGLEKYLRGIENIHVGDHDVPG